MASKRSNTVLGKWAAWLCCSCPPCGPAGQSGSRSHADSFDRADHDRRAAKLGLGSDPSADQDIGELIDVEVRLISGAQQLQSQVGSNTTVQNLLNAVCDGKAGRLLLGNEALRPRDTLADAGLRDGASLTLVLESRPPFSWDGARCGPLAELEADGRTVRRARDFYNAVVVAATPSRIFRLQIIDNSGNWSGAMEMGFTATCPNELLERMPTEARSLPRSWVMSNTGNVSINNSGLEGGRGGKAGNWHMAWKQGDRVKCSILDEEEDMVQHSVGEEAASELLNTTNSRFCVHVNEERELCIPIPDLPADLELYPVVALYGTTTGILLLDD